MKMPISRIKTERAEVISANRGIPPTMLTDFRENRRAGVEDQTPPCAAITVKTLDNGTVLLVDGLQRLRAAEQTGYKYIKTQEAV